MKSTSFVVLSLAAVASAIEPLPYLNVVRTEFTCRLDSDCTIDDLSYLEGNGRPNKNSDICCATFPRETWNQVS